MIFRICQNKPKNAAIRDAYAVDERENRQTVNECGHNFVQSAIESRSTWSIVKINLLNKKKISGEVNCIHLALRDFRNLKLSLSYISCTITVRSIVIVLFLYY